jgi:hypothetical protein
MISFSSIASYGSDLDREIDDEIQRRLLTPLGSLPFNRDEGTLLDQTENSPYGANLDILVRLSILEDFANYNGEVTGERQVLTDYDSIMLDDDEIKQITEKRFSKGVLIKYQRVLGQGTEVLL